MMMTNYMTTKTLAHIRGERDPQPSMRNGRAKPGIAAHHRALEKKEADK